jgi:DNA-binding XRE family transcriptional regulator
MKASSSQGRSRKRRSPSGAQETLGDLIAAARTRLSLTQEDLGERLGVGRRAVIRWELNRVRPRYEQIRQLIDHVHPNDAALATRIAGSFGLILGGVPSPPQSMPVEHLGDGLVAVAASVLDTSPRLVRPALIATIQRARALGLTLDDFERALAAGTPKR